MESVQSDVLLMLDKAKTKNYYDLLSVPTSASPDEIKKSTTHLQRSITRIDITNPNRLI
jgi:hypothetical protein